MKKKSVITFSIIVCIATLFFFSRLYNLDKRIGFDWDQEKISYDVKNILLDHKLTLLGPRANNDKGFFLGPQFTYLLVPFYFATHLHPNALLYFIFFYCLFFFIAAYLILRRVFNLKIALLFLLMWGINTIFFNADTSPFWPILIPLGVLLIWFFLNQIFNSPGEFKPWLSLGLCIGFILNIHFQSVFLLAYVCFFLYISRKKIKMSFINGCSLLSGIILMFFPLLFFDLRHNFFNTSLFVHFFLDGNTGHGPIFTAWIPVFSHIATPFVFIKNELFAGLFFYALGILVILLNRNKKTGFMKSFYSAFIVVWLLFPIMFALYGKRPSEYYFTFLYPFIVVSIIDFFLSRKYYYFLSFYLVVYVVMNITTLYPKLYAFGLNFYEKDRAVKRISKVLNNKKCDIAFNVPWGREVGYKYLFDYYQIKQIGNWKSCVININIPARPKDEKFDYLGVTFPKELVK